jgi:hypothetical protein
MPPSVRLFCLACGEEVPEPLRRTASLRCLECREAGAPISFELALRARESTRLQTLELLRAVRNTAA